MRGRARCEWLLYADAVAHASFCNVGVLCVEGTSRSRVSREMFVFFRVEGDVFGRMSFSSEYRIFWGHVCELILWAVEGIGFICCANVGMSALFYVEFRLCRGLSNYVSNFD